MAAGLSVPMDRLGLAYGQVLAKGRLQGGELKQFTEAGVPMIAELAKNLGKTQAEISKMVENGEIGAKDVTKAFETMTTGTGRFADLMDKQSQTLAGKWSNLVDATTQLGEKIGMYFIPILTKAVDALSALGQFFGTAAGKAVLIGTAVATLTFGIGMLIPVVIGLAGAFTTAAAAGGLLE